jgi:hypothetical protein
VSNFGYNSQSVSGRNTMVAKLVIWTYWYRVFYHVWSEVQLI